MSEFNSDLIKALEDAYRYARQKFYFMVGKGNLNNTGSGAIEFLADEVAQEVCVVVFLRYLFDSLKGIDNFKYWVYGITKYKTIDLTDKFVYRPAILSLDYQNELKTFYDQSYSESNPENVFETEEENDILDRMINDLNPRQKLIASLYKKGEPNKEIAEILNITPGNVGATIFYIKERLSNNAQQYID